MPLSTKVNRDGMITIKFGRDLFVESAENLSDVVKESGSIQVQLLDSSPTASSRSSKDFDWEFAVEEKRKVVISLFFKNSGAVSSSSNDYDQARVVFVDTRQFLRCETVADLFTQGKRALNED